MKLDNYELVISFAAIYGASTNRGFMWKFDSEKDLKCSMCRSLGSIYKTMLKDGYIKIKVGHKSYTGE